MIKNLVLVFVSCILSQSLFAQLRTTNDANENLEALDGGSSVVRGFDSRYEGVKGSPFFKEEWGEALLFLDSNSEGIKSNVLVNVYEQELLFKKAGQIMAIDIKRIDSLQLKDYDNTLVVFQTGKRYQFGEQVRHSKNEILFGYSKKLIRADYKGAFSAGNKYDEFIDDSKYFLKSANGYEKFKISQSSLAKLDESYDKKKIREIVGLNGLDLNLPKDLSFLLKNL